MGHRSTRMREPAVQFCPAFQNAAPARSAATTSSWSRQSAITICGLFPPHSSTMPFRFESAE